MQASLQRGASQRVKKVRPRAWSPMWRCFSGHDPFESDYSSLLSYLEPPCSSHTNRSKTEYLFVKIIGSTEQVALQFVVSSGRDYEVLQERFTSCIGHFSASRLTFACGTVQISGQSDSARTTTIVVKALVVGSQDDWRITAAFQRRSTTLVMLPPEPSLSVYDGSAERGRIVKVLRSMPSQSPLQMLRAPKLASTTVVDVVPPKLPNSASNLALGPQCKSLDLLSAQSTGRLAHLSCEVNDISVRLNS
ncbi:hypothetical protein R3P38DRAFT_11053 [Favolaschia claudopus]|uniref:Uncharacterized protein n=1 Tax=Favolaschia claudopus TaxID=2862362 RepID=A0AAW0EDL8_9AGAR